MPRVMEVVWCALLQMATRKEVADIWTYILEESARRKQLLVDEQIRAAIEKSKPRSKKARKAKPWVSQGSEVRHSSNTGGIHRMHSSAAPAACSWRALGGAGRRWHKQECSYDCRQSSPSGHVASATDEVQTCGMSNLPHLLRRRLRSRRRQCARAVTPCASSCHASAPSSTR